MDVFYIKPYASDKNVIALNEQTAEKYGLSKKKRGYVSFGSQKKFVDIVVSDRVPRDQIVLSNAVIEYLCVPTYIRYELKTNENEIIIGPYIGILANQKDKDITKRRLKKLSMSMLDYPKIHGAVVAFALDKVNMSKRLVEGYCYNPERESWGKGTFPYPSAIYKRTGMNDEMLDHFVSIIGDKVFNNYYFDKWKMYQWFLDERSLRPYIPETMKLSSGEDILKMVHRYRNVYIKPIQGMKGFGVVKASIKGSGVLFQFRKDEENNGIYAGSEDEVLRAAGALFKSGDYIIQQGLNFISYNGRVVDFRCIMQKDENNRWVCNGIVARTGARLSIVSNISSGGMAYPAEEILRDGLMLNQDEIFTVKERMAELCINVCKTLDRYGINYGMLGLDIGIDDKKRLWIIEINNRYPHPAIAMRANEMDSYYTVLSYPLHYAKWLAGF